MTCMLARRASSVLSKAGGKRAEESMISWWKCFSHIDRRASRARSVGIRRHAITTSRTASSTSP
eukprot:9690601-Lingulodinium_polyedra.AAC.1